MKLERRQPFYELHPKDLNNECKVYSQFYELFHDQVVSPFVRINAYNIVYKTAKQLILFGQESLKKRLIRCLLLHLSNPYISILSWLAPNVSS